MHQSVSLLDWAIIVIYLGGIVGAGVWVGLRKRKGGEAGSYFLAGNTLGRSSIGLALFATNISCLHLVHRPINSGHIMRCLPSGRVWLVG